MPKDLRRFLWWPIVFLTALLLGGAVGFVVFSLGLITHPYISTALSIVATALVAALGAAWAGTVLANDGTRTRLLPVVSAVEAVAILLVAVFTTIVVTSITGYLGGELGIIVAVFWMGNTLLLALTATVATRRLRTSAANLRRDALVTLGLLALALAIIVATLFVASLFGLVGA